MAYNLIHRSRKQRTSAYCASLASNILKSNPRVSNTSGSRSLPQLENFYSMNNYSNVTNLYENVDHINDEGSIDTTVLYENVVCKYSVTHPIKYETTSNLPNENVATTVSKHRSLPKPEKKVKSKYNLPRSESKHSSHTYQRNDSSSSSDRNSIYCHISPLASKLPLRNIPDDDKASNYTQMSPEIYTNMQGHSVDRLDEVDSTNNRSSYMTMDIYERKLSVPDLQSLPKISDKFHFKGDDGCKYRQPSDYIYLEVLDPTAIRTGGFPFTKQKEKNETLLCFCRDTLSIDDKSKSSSQLVFLSCESIRSSLEVNKDNAKPVVLREKDTEVIVKKDVSFGEDNKSETSSSRRRSRVQILFKKKLDQVKQLFVDW